MNQQAQTFGIGEDVDSWKTVIFLYNAALKEVGTKLEILNDEFQHVHKYNPIEHIKTRIKTPESIVKKLKRYGRETSIVNMVKYINDIAGVRVICSFTSDIYRIAEMISNPILQCPPAVPSSKTVFSYILAQHHRKQQFRYQAGAEFSASTLPDNYHWIQSLAAYPNHNN